STPGIVNQVFWWGVFHFADCFMDPEDIIGGAASCYLLPRLFKRSRGWLTVKDAMEYLDAVKREFRDQPEIYDEFLAIMGRFKTKQMLPPDVIVEVARLFRGRNQLVLSFNRFLPEGFKIGHGDIARMEEECVAKEQAAARAARSGDNPTSTAV
ncbi:unnamed protein product, partial [Scytosiphon promiscuus]